MMLEIAVHLRFAGGLGERDWGLEENEARGNGGKMLGGSLLGVGLDD